MSEIYLYGSLLKRHMGWVLGLTFLFPLICGAMDDTETNKYDATTRPSPTQQERDELIDLLLSDTTEDYSPRPLANRDSDASSEDQNVEILTKDLLFMPTAAQHNLEPKVDLKLGGSVPSGLKTESSSSFRHYLDSLSPKTREGYIQALAASPRNQDPEDQDLAEELRKYPAQSRLSLNLSRVSTGTPESPRKSPFTSRRSSSARNSPSGESPKGVFSLLKEKVMGKKESPREVTSRKSLEDGSVLGSFTPPGKDNE